MGEKEVKARIFCKRGLTVLSSITVIPTVILALTLPISSTAYSKITVSPRSLSSLSTREVVATVGIIESVKALLPDVLKSQLPQEITVRFESLNDRNVLLPKCSSETNEEKEPVTYGEFHGLSKSILIEKSILEWYFDDILLDCFHKSSRRMSFSVLIHEIFHLYDHDQNLTGDIVFQNKSFWGKRRNNIRVPDPYEAHNVKEYGAVNFEYFVLDKEYKCRRPLQYDYFSKKFDHIPFPSYQCPAYNKVQVLSFDGKSRIVDIEEERIYQIQYLLAEKGDESFSSFPTSAI